jgi:hypothetical protein
MQIQGAAHASQMYVTMHKQYSELQALQQQFVSKQQQYERIQQQRQAELLAQQQAQAQQQQLFFQQQQQQQQQQQLLQQQQQQQRQQQLLQQQQQQQQQQHQQPAHGVEQYAAAVTAWQQYHQQQVMQFGVNSQQAKDAYAQLQSSQQALEVQQKQLRGPMAPQHTQSQPWQQFQQQQQPQLAGGPSFQQQASSMRDRVNTRTFTHSHTRSTHSGLDITSSRVRDGANRDSHVSVALFLLC